MINYKKIIEVSKESNAVKAYIYIYTILIILVCIWVAAIFPLSINNPNSLLKLLNINLSFFSALIIGVVFSIIIFFISYFSLILNANFLLLKPFLEGDKKQIKRSIVLMSIILMLGLIILFFKFSVSFLIAFVLVLVFMILNVLRLKEI